MIIVDCKQGSDEWRKLRCGIPTASNFDMLITPTGKISGQYSKLKGKLMAEWLTGESDDDFMSHWMERGNEMEPEARSFYEFDTGAEVIQVGLCYLNEEKAVAASPDGLMGGDGGLEIKCPKLSNHLSYCYEGGVPSKYLPQIQGGLYITDREWWDFVSYHPGYPPYVARVFRDEAFIGKLKDAINKLTDDLGKERERMKAYRQ